MEYLQSTAPLPRERQREVGERIQWLNAGYVQALRFCVEQSLSTPGVAQIGATNEGMLRSYLREIDELVEKLNHQGKTKKGTELKRKLLTKAEKTAQFYSTYLSNGHTSSFLKEQGAYDMLALATSWKKERTALYEELLAANIRFARREAGRFHRAHRFLQSAEVQQQAIVGMLLAAATYDGSTTFITYAAHYIRAELQNHLRAYGRTVRAVKSMKERRLFSLLPDLEKRARHNEIEDVDTFIATESGEDVEFVRRFRAALLPDLPLEAVVEHSYEEDYSSLDYARVRDAMGILEPRDRTIIARCELSDSPSSFQEVGQELQLSRERVRQLRNRALDRLTTMLA